MATLPLMKCDLTEEEAKAFLPHYRFYMAARVPNIYIGVSSASYSIQKVIGEDYEIVLETNKAINNGSSQLVRNLSAGFLAGWKARGEAEVARIEAERNLDA